MAPGDSDALWATRDISRTDVDQVRRWARHQTDAWGVPPSHVAHWLMTAGELLPPSETGRVELSYDAGLGLLSLDVWCGGRRLYGMDDWVSWP